MTQRWPTEDNKLDEYDAVEWYYVAKHLQPGLTLVEFQQRWEQFQLFKAEHAVKASQQ